MTINIAWIEFCLTSSQPVYTSVTIIETTKEGLAIELL